MATLVLAHVGVDFYVVRTGELAVGELISRDGLSSVEPSLRYAIADGDPRVLESAKALYLECNGTPIAVDDESGRHWLAEWVTSGVRSGQLSLYRHAFSRYAFERVHPPGTSGRDDSAETPRETAWIEITLVDQNDTPYPGEAYRIEWSDGSVQEGQLDGSGFARVSGGPPGSCAISFPRFDVGQWSRPAEDAR